MCLLLDGAAVVTADDVRDRVKVPPGIDPRCLGAVPGPLARAGAIRSAGYAKSTRPETHARVLVAWRLADRAAAMRWLRDHPAPAADSPTPIDAPAHAGPTWPAPAADAQQSMLFE